MIADLTPSVTHPVETLADLGKHRRPDRPVVIRQMDVFPSVIPRGDVVKTSGEFKS